MTKNAIIYVRVSTEEQATKGYSIEAQTQRCLEYAKQNNYSTIKIFTEEGKSGKNLNRPALQEMFKYIKLNSKNIDTLIFWKWDRLSRGEDADYVKLGTLFDKYEITPLSSEENNETTPEGKLMRKITRATSAYEIDKGSQRTKLGLRRKAEEGYFPGKAPIGYLNKRNSEDKGIIVIDEANTFYVKRIFEYYASGMYSLDSLGEKMFLEGFKDKYGKAYRARKIEEILKNIFYIGDFMWSGTRYTGKHKPIIDKATFYQVQSKFGLTNKPKQNFNNFTYTNFIKCAKCGCYMTAEVKKGAHNSGNYIYYHCTNRKKMHTSLKGLIIREEVIDHAFQNILDSIYIPAEVIKALKNKIISNLDEIYKEENKILDNKIKRIKDLDHLIAKSYEEKLLGKLPDSFTDETFNRQSSKWQQERDMLSIDIKESCKINRAIYKNIDLLLGFCNRIPELFVKASTDDKRLLLRMVIEKIEYSENNLSVKLKPIFETLRLIKVAQKNKETNNKVRTLKSTDNSELTEYLLSQINLGVNSRVRTLETSIIPNKKDPEGSILINGASDGIRTHAYRNHNPRS